MIGFARGMHFQRGLTRFVLAFEDDNDTVNSEAERAAGF